MGGPAPLDGLARGGCRLVFDDKSGEIFKSEEALSKSTNLTYSVGFEVAGDGRLSNVLWGAAAFQAGLSAGVRVLAVDGTEFSADGLKDATTAAKGGSQPVELTVKDDDRYRTVRIDYHGGLRYPHLERVAGAPARLDAIATPKS